MRKEVLINIGAIYFMCFDTGQREANKKDETKYNLCKSFLIGGSKIQKNLKINDFVGTFSVLKYAM